MPRHSSPDIFDEESSQENYLSKNLQALLQVISHKGIMLDSELRETCRKICGGGNSRLPDYTNFISQINSSLKDIDLEIKSTDCEVTGDKYWTLVCTVFNESDNEGEEEEDETERGRNRRRSAGIDQEDNDEEIITSKFSKVQMQYLKSICDEIILSDECCISSIDCINLVGNVEGRFSRANAEKFLKFLMKGHWLTPKDGKIYMGARCIAELMQYFKSVYESVLTSCPLCKQMIIYGYQCPCGTKTHLQCLKNYMEVRQNVKCLKCGADVVMNQSQE